MAFSTAYSYGESSFFYSKILIEAFKFIFINFILALIFLFLTLEQLDWTLFTSTRKVNDKVIDNTSWNIKKIF